MANGVQRRIKKVTPLLLLGVTEGARFGIANSTLTSFIKNAELQHNHNRKKSII
jgi:hypothetical protein